MIPAAAVIPWTPKGAKSARLLEFQPKRPMMMNKIRMEILISTMTVFTFADSLAPRISSNVQSAIKITAGRLKIPPCSGACDSASGILKPNSVVQQLVEILRPADCDRGGRHAILEQQATGDRHCRQFTDRRVGIRV